MSQSRSSGVQHESGGVWIFSIVRLTEAALPAAWPGRPVPFPEALTVPLTSSRLAGRGDRAKFSSSSPLLLGGATRPRVPQRAARFSELVRAGAKAEDVCHIVACLPRDWRTTWAMASAASPSLAAGGFPRQRRCWDAGVNLTILTLLSTCFDLHGAPATGLLFSHPLYFFAFIRSGLTRRLYC